MAIFDAWRRHRVDFLVLRNYETLPEVIENDLDVLVRPVARDLAERTLIEAARSCGFIRHNRAEFATLASYFYEPQSGLQLHVDLFTDLKWRSLEFLQTRRFLEQRVARGTFFIPHPAHEAATNLLATMIYNGNIKEKYKPSVTRGFRDHAIEAKQLLAPTYGSSLADLIVDCGAQERWTQLQNSTSELRGALIRRQVARQPFQLLKSMAADTARLVRRWLHPPGLAIVICGPDGSGKSTAATGVIDALSTTFAPLKGRQFHWKAPVFSGRRMAARQPTTQPHAAHPRNMLPSLIYLCFHWLEFYLGAFIRLRPVVFKNGLVLIDRGYYDFFVDQQRYRLRLPLSVVRLGYLLLPKPDLVLLLDAPAEILQQRKAEVPPAETERQRERYLSLIRPLPQGRIIDAVQSPEAVVGQMKRVVLDFMAERMKRRKDLSA